MASLSATDCVRAFGFNADHSAFTLCQLSATRDYRQKTAWAIWRMRTRPGTHRVKAKTVRIPNRPLSMFTAWRSANGLRADRLRPILIVSI